MRCIIYSPHWLRTVLLFVVKSAFYILTLAWGFRRCSFRLVGQCESLYSVERVTEQAPRFFVCIQNINQSNNTEWSCCSNGNGMRLENSFISNLDDSQRKITRKWISLTYLYLIMLNQTLKSYFTNQTKWFSK